MTLRIHIDPIKHVETVAIGVWFGVGTRDEETPAHNGIAHLTEHMLFKGTTTRSALDIVQQIENVGANINAYTGREITAYTVYGLKHDVRLALDILADMIRNSTFIDSELALEKNIIVQEMSMAADTPDDIIHDDAFEMAYAGQSFGRPVLGREAVIRALSSGDLHDYTQKQYHPGNCVISVAGNVDEAQVSDMATQLFDGWSRRPKTQHAPSAYSGGVHRAIKNDLEQTHIIYGVESYPRQDPRQAAMTVFTEALGGGMASRLFQEIREKRGLAYSVYAANQPYSDTGFLSIYAGTDPQKAQECLTVIRDELANAAQHLKDTDINRAKTGRKAALLMARESMMARADRNARQILVYGRPIPVDETIAKIDAVTRADIETLCTELAARPFTCALRGPKVDVLAV